MTADNKTILGARLLKVSEYIRDGAVLCDVGCDHAKLPIYLSRQGRIKHAYATDINIGPIESARSNINDSGLSDKIQCILTDGLWGTEGLSITDISICGMGGELIADILGNCTYIKDEDLNLVLQPMTHIHDLRRYLFENGFYIYDEALTEESGKLYTIICAKYTGNKTVYNEAQLYLGTVLSYEKYGKLYLEMCSRILFHLKNKHNSSDINERSQAARLYCQIKEIIEK